MTWTVIANGNTSQGNVRTDLTLPLTGASGTTISWVSDKELVISNTGVVTRPVIGESNETVTLTATITKGTATDTVVFTLTVRALT